MTTATDGAPRGPRPPYWIVGPREVWDGTDYVTRLVPECRHGHPLLSRDTNAAGSVYEWRGDMHLVFTCKHPHCGAVAFGVLHTRPSPLLHLYAITPQQLRAYLRLPHDTPTHEILELFGYITTSPPKEAA